MDGQLYSIDPQSRVRCKKKTFIVSLNFIKFITSKLRYPQRVIESNNSHNAFSGYIEMCSVTSKSEKKSIVIVDIAIVDLAIVVVAIVDVAIVDTADVDL